MLKLIRLEWKKNNIIKYIRNAFIMTICWLIFLLVAAEELETEDTVLLKSAVELFTNMSFIIFTSTMLASFIVGTYKNKTINLIFSYPISRKKIVLSQILSVWIFNFIALTLSKVLIYAALVITRKYTHIMADNIALGSGVFYIEILVNSAVMVSVSFIALLIGLKMKSSKATIIAGVIILCFTQGNIGSYTLLNNMLFHVTLLMISAISVFLTLYKL